MSGLDDAITQAVSDVAGDFLCKQIVKQGEFTKKIVPDPFGTYKLLVDLQSSFLQGLLSCPDDVDTNKIFGEEIQFTGGQCATGYTVNITFQGPNDPAPRTRTYPNEQGPIGAGTNRPYPPNPGAQEESGFFVNGGALFITTGIANTGTTPLFTTVDSVTRVDGQADNCGDYASGEGQIDGTFDDLQDISIEESTVNYNFTYDYGGTIGEVDINLPFSNFQVDTLVPFSYSFDAGGQRYEVNEDEVIPKPIDDDTSQDIPKRLKEISNKLTTAEELLEEIKDCTCDENPDIELETFNAPLAECTGSEGDKSAEKVFVPLQVLKDSISAQLAASFDASAELGLEGCVCDNAVEQANAMELWTSQSTMSTRVQFSPVIPAEVMSVVLQINSYELNEVRLYVLAGVQSEGKFGSLNVSIDQFDSAGMQTYLWTSETYVRLPARTKPIRVRVTTKPGTNFTLWDTGERGQLKLAPAA